MATILVIDDEHNIRMMVRMALKAVGHEVVTAADGPEGLQEYRDGREWDLVLLDQRMPGMDGLTVLKEIRRRNPDARIIMITAFGTIDLAVEAMRAGARDFLRKPFTADVLRGAVSASLTSPVVRQPESSPITYGLTTINGFHIDWQPDDEMHVDGGISQRFTITDPDQHADTCTVVMPAVVVEKVREHVGASDVLRTDRFWQALCEEVVANYVWQHGDFPPDGRLSLDDLSSGLLRWVDVVTDRTG